MFSNLFHHLPLTGVPNSGTTILSAAEFFYESITSLIFSPAVRCYLVSLSLDKLALIAHLPLADAELPHQRRAVKEVMKHRGTKIKLPGTVLDQTAADPGGDDSLSPSLHFLLVFL